MEYTTKIYEKLNERYYYSKHPSGLDIYIIPKKHSTAYAQFGTKYGSVDTTFKINDGSVLTVPAGIAHFLEHKLFESEDGGDTFERYAEFGGNANAYTSMDKTAYLFSCTECFDENLEILLDFVQKPYFTAENVQKEMGIIGQEIKMGEDRPDARVFYSLLESLYEKNNVRINIAGTVESISRITPEILYDCYNTFYNLNNMALCVCGDVTPEQVLTIADKTLKKAAPLKLEVIRPEEPDKVYKKTAEAEMEVSMPLYAIGIKEPTPIDYTEAMKRHAAHEIILHCIFGESSEFYTRVYEEGLITGNYSEYHELGRGFAFVGFEGSSPEPMKLYETIIAEIKTKRENFFTKEEFDRAVKVMYSNCISSFDSTESVANTFMRFLFLENNLFDYPELIKFMDYEYTKSIFNEVYSEKNMAISIVNPIK